VLVLDPQNPEALEDEDDDEDEEEPRISISRLDFGLWSLSVGREVHRGKSTLATAIAAIPSSRPINPNPSFVVAFTPIC
jgi:hypothetical protein